MKKQTKTPFSFIFMFNSLIVLWIVLGAAIALLIGIWPFGWLIGLFAGYTSIDFAKFSILYLYTVPKEHQKDSS